MPVNKTAIPDHIVAEIAARCNADEVSVTEVVQELWSGYGAVARLLLQRSVQEQTHSSDSPVQNLGGENTQSVIIKFINPPASAAHPRGWNTSASHQRKLRSYEVETTWYQTYASRCSQQCKVPAIIDNQSTESESWLLMEDLTHRYPVTAGQLNVEEALVCIDWLAHLHAQFLGQKPEGLWPVGTYWHLATRVDELAAMTDPMLKRAALPLDDALNACEYQTIVHGDAKVANFRFSQNMREVAGVDFQYVGGGVGIKDVAYFFGSCLDETTIAEYENELLERYFNTLRAQISITHDAALASQVDTAWRDLYAIAWTDFYRFLDGWMPSHKKINHYTKQMARRAFKQLGLI